MKSGMRNLLLGVAGVLLLAIGCLTVLYWGELRRWESLAAQLAKTRSAVKMETVRAGSSDRSEQGKTQTVSAKPRSTSGGDSIQVAWAYDEAQLRSRDWNLQQTRNRQRRVVHDFGYLFDAMGNLDPAVRRQLKDLLCERQLILEDSYKALLKQGVPFHSDLYWDIMYAATAEIDQKMASLCGADGPRFTELLNLGGAMWFINLGISGAMEFAEVPLSSEQKLQLAAMMKDVHYSIADPLYQKVQSEPVDPATGLMPVFRDLLGKAGAILSPQQLAVLGAEQDRLLALKKAHSLSAASDHP
jgi:hypothetical protein